MVSAEQFEQALCRAREQALATTGDARQGLFGEGSVAWRVNREAMLLMGGGAAALLQLSHPFVAQAVYEHSRVRRDVAGRFRRTFARLLAMTFGDLDGAITSARRVRAIHDRVAGDFPQPTGQNAAGSRYAAHDEGALFFVQATLLDTAQRVYMDLVAPLSDADRRDFYASSKPMALLFGLLPESLPADVTAFSRYYADILDSNTLHVGKVARELAQHILTPPNRAVQPLYRFIRAYTAALLPERFRREFALPYGLSERTFLRATLCAMRGAIPLLPQPLRYFPGYLDAQRRLRGETGTDEKSHKLSLKVLRLLRPTFALRSLLS
jgi:uncharacterized protein (DUF2236 family)